jgi:outer membrane protein OmpA-like peptidoglycan-associated protein
MSEKDKEKKASSKQKSVKKFETINVNDVDWSVAAPPTKEQTHMKEDVPVPDPNAKVYGTGSLKSKVTKNPDEKGYYGSVCHSTFEKPKNKDQQPVSEVTVGRVMAHKTQLSDVHFDTGSANLLGDKVNGKENEKQIKQDAQAIIKYLTLHPKAHIEVHGYTDTQSGKDGKYDNQALSEKRTQNTYEALLKEMAEISPNADFSDRVKIGNSYGKVGAQREQTLDQADSAANRRVEIVGVEPERKPMYDVYNTKEAKGDISFDFKSGEGTSKTFTTMVDGIKKEYPTTTVTPEGAAKVVLDTSKTNQHITVAITDPKNIAFAVDTKELVSYHVGNNNDIKIYAGDKEIANVKYKIKDPQNEGKYLSGNNLKPEDVTVSASNEYGKDDKTVPVFEKTKQMEGVYTRLKAADKDGKDGLSQKEIEDALAGVNKELGLEKDYQEKNFNSQIKGKKDGQGNEYKKDVSRVIEDSKYYTLGEGESSELGKVLKGADGKVDNTKDENITFKELDTKIKQDENFKRALEGLKGASGGTHTSVTEQYISSVTLAKETGTEVNKGNVRQ